MAGKVISILANGELEICAPINRGTPAIVLLLHGVGFLIHPLAQLIKNLVSIVVKDGNYLLNVGPTGSGMMEERQVKRLAQVGEWLAEYGETIYSTRGGPFKPDRWGGTVYRDNTVYVHITDWTEDKISLLNINNKLVSFESPTSNNVSVTQLDKTIEIEVPLNERHNFDTIIELNFANPIEWDGVAGIEKDYYGLADGLKHKSN